MISSLSSDAALTVHHHSYRLGAPGFLTSDELRKEGFKSNQGHHDQRVALQYVKRYISGFGGDPHKITVIGESAGGSEFTPNGIAFLKQTGCSEEPSI